MGQLSDPYEQGEDDGLQISVSGLPEDPEEPVDDDLAPTDDLDGGELDGDDVDAAEEVGDSDDDGGDGDGDDDDDEDDDEFDDEDEVAYELTDWSNEQLDALFDGLDQAKIAFNWDGEELFIRAADEQAVDELLEKVAQPNELVVEEDDGEDGGGWLLGELFVVADRLQHDPEEHESVASLLQLANAADEASAPYGLADAEWDALRAKVTALATVLEDAKPDPDAVIEAARELRSATRPYV
jgi:hypothetical protein